MQSTGTAPEPAAGVSGGRSSPRRAGAHRRCAAVLPGARRRSDLGRAVAAGGLVVLASSGVQLSATMAHQLFDRLGAPQVSGLRFAVAAAVMLLVLRPAVRGRSRGDWMAIVGFGVVLAVMNVSLFLALQRLSLGLVVTLDFLGPFVVAVAGIRRLRSLAWPVLGLCGIALIAGPGGQLDPVGVAFALLSAVGYGVYVALAGRIGGAGRGFGGVALSVGVATVLLLPVWAPAVPHVGWADVGLLTLSGLLGVAVAYSADVGAVGLIGAPAVAVLLSLDPVIAALIGAGVLGETLTTPTVVGIALVAVAGGVTIWCAGHDVARRGAHRRPARSTRPRERLVAHSALADLRVAVQRDLAFVGVVDDRLRVPLGDAAG